MRDFGPFLVIRTREPVVTPKRYLERAGEAMLVGKRLYLGDADINLPTIERAARALRGYGASPLPLDQLAVAGRLLEGGEPGGGLALALLRPSRRAAASAADAPTAAPTRNERVRERRDSRRPWEDRRRDRLRSATCSWT